MQTVTTTSALTRTATAPAQLVQLTFSDGQPARLAVVTDRIVKGLMAVAQGDDAWLGHVEALDEGRLLLRRQAGSIVFDRNEVELLQLLVFPEGSSMGYWQC